MLEAATVGLYPAGDPARFLSLEYLVSRGNVLTPAPRDVGRVALIVRRTDGGARRETADRVWLSRERGVPGDGWERKEGRTLESQITAMQLNVAELIANGQPLTLFGDNLFLELDLSAANLNPGNRVRIGNALLEVTPKRHKGCKKFSGRFGSTSSGSLPGASGTIETYAGSISKVVDEGAAEPGDTVEVVGR